MIDRPRNVLPSAVDSGRKKCRRDGDDAECCCGHSDQQDQQGNKAISDVTEAQPPLDVVATMMSANAPQPGRPLAVMEAN